MTELAGAPGRDTINRIIGDPGMPASQADVVAVVTVLAREARWDVEDAVMRARDLWVAARMATPVGVPLAEVTDPFALEVHRPVQPDQEQAGLPDLPPYLPREHDAALARMVTAAAQGRSQIAVLVGGSSTGKTRACWEALHLLRDQPGPWRLWHPIDPTRPDAALRDLPGIGPRTVVWLNEAQFYLEVAEGGLGEQVAAGLRELLRDPGRAPVLVLATLWPQFWDTLTARPAGGDDRHAQARDLLAGHDIAVPAALTPAQVRQLDRCGRSAASSRRSCGHEDGEVIQFLAGAPELLARYRNAPPAAAALIDAAMDARRLGMGAGLPQAFLEAAAPGYLTDDEWDALGEDWLEQALAYTAVPCKGARGPLTRIRPRPASRAARSRGDQPASMAAAAGPLYRLADYLDQHGRAHRASQIPPAEFWSAAAAHAAPGDQAALGDAAHARGLYRDAAQLHKNAAASGNLRAALYLSRSPGLPARGPPPRALGRRPRRPRRPGRRGQPAGQPAGGGRARAGRRAAGPGSRRPRRPRRPGRRGHPAGQPAGGGRARAGRRAGRPGRRPRPPRRPGRRGQPAGQPAGGGRARAGRRAAGPRSRRPRRPRRPGGVASLLDSLREAGAHEQAAALAARAAAHAALDDPGGVAACWTACGRRARTSRPPRWPPGPPPTPPSTTRAAWPACWTACGRRARTSRPPRCWPVTPPPTPPSTTRAAWPACWTACGRRARTSRPPRCWPVTRRPRRPRRPGGVAACWTACGRRARTSRPPRCWPGRRPRPPRRPGRRGQPAGQPAGGGRARAGRRAGWPGTRRPRPPRRPGRRGQPAGQPAGGGRARAGRRAAARAAAHAPLDNPGGVARLLDSLRKAGAHEQAAALARSAAGGRHVRALPRAERPRGSVPFRTGGRRHPGRAMGLGRPGLMACSLDTTPAPKPKR